MVTHRVNPAQLPAVEARAVRVPNSPVWSLRVDDCPFCRKAHSHGGGTDAEPRYGHRAAHCAPLREDAAGGYELVPARGAR